MDMVEEEADVKRQCSECMYYKDGGDCIRKKQEVGDQGYCLHYVSAYERHSIVKLTEEIALFFKEH